MTTTTMPTAAPTVAQVMELRRLLAEATAGVWELDYDQGNTRKIMTRKAVIGDVRIHYVTRDQYAANAKLICATVNALPSLLDERDRLRKALACIHAALNQNATFPADVDLARNVASAALAEGGAK